MTMGLIKGIALDSVQMFHNIQHIPYLLHIVKCGELWILKHIRPDGLWKDCRHLSRGLTSPKTWKYHKANSIFLKIFLAQFLYNFFFFFTQPFPPPPFFFFLKDHIDLALSKSYLCQDFNYNSVEMLVLSDQDRLIMWVLVLKCLPLLGWLWFYYNICKYMYFKMFNVFQP